MTTENESCAGVYGNGSTQGKKPPSISHEPPAIQIKMPNANSAKQPGSQSHPKTDSNDHVEGLLHNLMGRLDDNDRRYGEALENMYDRLDELGERARMAGNSGPANSLSALDRVREQAHSLSDQINSADQQHKAHRSTSPKDLAQRISAVTDRIDTTGTHNDDQRFDTQPGAEVNDDFAEVTQNLENSLAAHTPANEFDYLASRMDALASRFDDALDSKDNVQTLESIETQLNTLAGRFSDAQKQHERIESIETHLLNLMDWAKSTESTPGKKSDDRFDAIELAIKALNDNAREMDSRTLGTLETMNNALQSLAKRIDKTAKADIPKRHTSKVDPPDDYPEVWVDIGEEIKLSPDSLVHRHMAQDLNQMGAAIPDYQPAPGHPEASKNNSGKTDSINKAPKPLEPDSEIENDFIASAKRAAAAANAEQSPASRRLPGNETAIFQSDTKRQRPLLVMAAVGLLLVSAGLLYSRLKNSPEIISGNGAALFGSQLPSPALSGPSSSSPSSTGNPVTKPLEVKPAGGKKKLSERMPYRKNPESPSGPEPAETSTKPAKLPVKRASLRAPETSKSAKTAHALSEARFNQPISTATVLARLTPSTDAGLMSGVSASIKEAAAPALVPSGKDKNATAPMVQPKRVPKPSRTGQTALSRGTLDSARANETLSPSSDNQSAMPPATIGPQSLRMAAARGNPAAQMEVASRYAKGSGVKRNQEKAALWFSRAASQGYAPAQYRLATLHERGQGVKQDIGMARTWYRRSAELGNVRAMHNLAVLHTRSKENGPDYVSAKNWFYQGARYGLADSQFNLGILYESGLGTKKDTAEAYKWFTLAARQGDKGALKRRELIRPWLSAKALSAVEQTLKTWEPIPSKQAANRSGPPKGGWQNARTENTSAGSDPALIARAQFLLNKLGFDAGAPDGKMGPKTAAAIRKFEGRSGKTKTGKVTPVLLRRLAVLGN